MTIAPSPPERPSEALLARLDDPQTAADLNRLLDRVGELNALFDMLEGALKRGPDLSNNVGRLIRETRERVPGIETDLPRLAQQGQRVSQALATPEAEKLLSKLEDPATLNAMNQLVDKLPDLLAASQMLDAFLKRGPDISNNVGRLLREFRTSQGQPGGLGELVSQVKNFDVLAASRGLNNLTQMANSPEMRNLAQSGIFSPETVNLVSDVAEAARLASHQNEQPLSAVSARPGLRATLGTVVSAVRDPAVQRTVSFALSFARNLGVALARRGAQGQR